MNPFGHRAMRRPLLAIWLLACLVAGVAHAQTRAWLDRDRIALGETTTLNVESEDTTAAPDWTPLTREFDLEGHTSRRQVEIRDGRRIARTLHGVALRPRREGLLAVPALDVGGARTAPLQLSVGPATVRAARDGAPAFVEAEVDTQSPYVQQAVAYTVRLHYAVSLVSGQLEQPPPDGASLQRIGNDKQYTRDLDGRRYTVVERRFLLVPERSGTLTIPGARFEGQGVSGGMFDGLFNRGPRTMTANGPPSLLDVRPMPAGADSTWLPVRDVQARWLEAPDVARAGTAATLVLEAVLDGAVGTQLPDVPLPSVDGAQVFADAPQYDETFEDGRPQVRLTRRFSVVPQRPGALRIEPPRIAWWDVGAGTARTASPPPLTLQVAPGTGQAASARDAVDAPGAVAIDADPAVAGSPARPWQAATVVFAALWLATLVWVWRRRRGPAAVTTSAPRSGSTADAGPATSTRSLLDLLRTGEAGDVDLALRRLVVPAAPDLDALSRRLEDAAQRAALTAWQRARWTGGDVVAARQQLRDAFRDGVRSSPPAAAEAAAAPPPLYPRR